MISIGYMAPTDAMQPDHPTVSETMAYAEKTTTMVPSEIAFSKFSHFNDVYIHTQVRDSMPITVDDLMTIWFHSWKLFSY